MINRCCIVLLHLLMLNEVSLQEPIVGFIGGSAYLHCSSKHQLKLQDITVRWRYNDSLNVYDIIYGEGSLKEQHSAYTNRVKTFPAEYEKGNFSLQLTNLKQNDTGKYICYESEIQSVELLVKEKEKSIQVEEKNKQTEEKGNQGAQSRPEKIVTLVAVLSVFILLCI